MAAHSQSVLPVPATSGGAGLRAQPPRMVRLRRGGQQIRIQPDLVEALVGPGGLCVDRWQDSGTVETVKRGRHRTVYRLVLSAGTFFVKHYHTPDWKTTLRTILRGSKAEREWRAIRRVAAAGVPTVEPVAVASRRRGPFAGESVLVTRAIPDVVCLHDWFLRRMEERGPLEPAQRRLLSAQLARLTAQLHAHGLRHGDLHAGNILMRFEQAGTLRLWLIDLHTVHPYRRLSIRQIVSELAMFRHFFLDRSNPTDQLRFFKIYWDSLKQATRARESTGRIVQAVNSNRSSRRRILQKLLSVSSRWSHRAFFKADAKWFRGHRKLIIHRNRGVECRTVAELGSEAVRDAVGGDPPPEPERQRGTSGLCPPPKPNRIGAMEAIGAPQSSSIEGRVSAPEVPAICRELGDVRLWKGGVEQSVREMDSIHGKNWANDDGDNAPQSKRPLVRRWLGRRRHWSPARCIWEIGHALLRRGIRVRRPLMWIEHTSTGREILVTERLRCRSGVVSSYEETLPPCLARRAGCLVRRLHGNGFLHAGLSPDVFVVEAPEAGVPGSAANGTPRDSAGAGRIVLDNVEAVIPMRRVKHRDIVGQLARLNDGAEAQSIPLAMRLRFLLAYLGGQRRGEWKSLWNDVVRHGKPRAASTASRDEEDRSFAGHSASPGTRQNRRGFLRAALAAAGLFMGCRSAEKQIPTRPARHSIRSGPLVVMSDFKLRGNHPIIEDLVRLRKQVNVTLKLSPQREEVVVYIFGTHQDYRNYLDSAFPGLPSRRAYFVGTASELAVFTYWGERIQEDLRHEYTHGILHASLKSVPLWLDEGLAEYFEMGGPRPGTINTDYAGRLAASLANGWQPKMERLESLEDFSQMQHVDYQEAWAWVHFLLHHSPETQQVLLTYLDDLRTKRNPPALSTRLQRKLPDFERRFLAHVASLQTPQLLFGQSRSGRASAASAPQSTSTTLPNGGKRRISRGITPHHFSDESTRAQKMRMPKTGARRELQSAAATGPESQKNRVIQAGREESSGKLSPPPFPEQ